MRTTPHAHRTERVALPRRLVPRRPATDINTEPKWAYLEWLTMEARLLRIELGVDDETSPRNTFAKAFHFPAGQDWRDVPQPSTRAELVMNIVGVQFPQPADDLPPRGIVPRIGMTITFDRHNTFVLGLHVVHLGGFQLLRDGKVVGVAEMAALERAWEVEVAS